MWCYREVVARRIVRVISGLASFSIYEVSLLTTLYPEGFDCMTGRSDMICDMYAICGKLIVMCAYVWYVGRKAICYGPEGDYVMGRKAWCMTRRSGPGKAYVRKCILGNSLSIYAYSCCACISGTSDDRGKAPAWSIHTEDGFMILGVWIIVLTE